MELLACQAIALMMISKVEVATENIATRCVAVRIAGETAEADMAAF